MFAKFLQNFGEINIVKFFWAIYFAKLISQYQKPLMPAALVLCGLKKRNGTEQDGIIERDGMPIFERNGILERNRTVDLLGSAHAYREKHKSV